MVLLCAEFVPLLKKRNTAHSPPPCAGLPCLIHSPPKMAGIFRECLGWIHGPQQKYNCATGAPPVSPPNKTGTCPLGVEFSGGGGLRVFLRNRKRKLDAEGVCATNIESIF